MAGGERLQMRAVWREKRRDWIGRLWGPLALSQILVIVVHSRIFFDLEVVSNLIIQCIIAVAHLAGTVDRGQCQWVWLVLCSFLWYV